MDKKLAEDFDLHLKDIMMGLSSRLQKIQESKDQNEADHLRVKAILETKKSLLDICFWKANEYLDKTDSTVAEIYSQMYNNLASLFEKAVGMPTVIGGSIPNSNQTTPTMRDTTISN